MLKTLEFLIHVICFKFLPLFEDMIFEVHVIFFQIDL